MSDYKRFNGVTDFLSRVLNPRVPWWVAVFCSAIAMVALGLLLRDPDGNLPRALALLTLGGIALYGMAMVQWFRKQ